ncbi:oligosaccharyl transferase, archaeosortase A system-associated [Halapricum salinum]|uniref:dolichyl-phosphooligosaccharide-protein glycotransferase n=1 Tax=Halapricum salinum TaxID=1457250 RepID=A0A4D6HH36_9EURY|nr:oligosaccharyl transferase, archaeosortase A system-associated [Halapricum salinum]QCC52322.1 oligosaccharyl transferase, archaeosortase A system-associated [Halapricum salinum]
MSQESDEAFAEVDEALAWFKQWYHVPALLGLLVFAFWTRARTWGNFVSGGEVYFSGNDAWYHLRQVKYTARNWPETMPFEVWTNFPTGTSVSQFGTIYDQVIATAALVVGLGNPSQQTIELVHLFAPAVVGTLILIPTYYLGKRLGKNRFSGIVAAVIVALSSGTLLARGLVGSADHHVAEAFTQALAALAIVVALQVADQEKPVWELVLDRDYAGLRRPVAYAALAGIATALYMWVWPPGVLLLGILGLYVTIQAVLDHLKGRSPEHVLIAGAVLFVVTAVLMLLPIERLDVAPVKFSLLQPGLALIGAFWCAALAGISRIWDDRSYPEWTYAVVAFGTIIVGVAAIALLAPRVYNLFYQQFIRIFGRFVGQSPSGAAATVAEVRALPNPLETLQTWYGFVPFIALIGAGLAVVRSAILQKSRPELLFVVLWLSVMFSASYTQARFSYYLTVPFAVMAAYAIGTGFQYLSQAAREASTDVRPYQIMAVVTVLLLLVVPMAVGVSGQQSDVLSQSETREPISVISWDSSLDWLNENTPDQGNYGGEGNTLDYWGEFANVDDYDYPDGSYGVLSWWDYGHWITTEGESIPVANPFQESASDAARFLLAENETVANQEVLANMSEGENAQTRYVMVDWQMATGGSKFTAPPAFVDDKEASDYVQGVGLGQGYFLYTQDYYETMVNRLYRYHGSAMDPQPIVTRWGGGQDTQLLQTYSSMNAARAAVNNSTAAQVGGFGPYPSERVPALEHYRLVQVSDRTINPLQASHNRLIRLYQQGLDLSQFGLSPQRTLQLSERNPHWTKVFERVPGATIEGQGPANATVTATVEMRIPNTNRTFPYYQRAQTNADGEFTMTVPYASTGADEWGPDNGYTNTSVRATDSYQFAAQQYSLVNGSVEMAYYNATEDVTEAQVIGEDDSPVEVTLTEVDLPDQNQTNDTTDGSGDNSSDDDQNSGSSSIEPVFDAVEPQIPAVRVAG